MIAGLVDTILSLGALIAAQSAVVLADFLKTLLEFVAVLLAWLAIRRIRRGAGATYDYGIGKLENLSSLAVAALMILVVLVIVGNAVRGILLPAHIVGIGVYVSLVLQVVYAGINGALWKRAERAMAGENSPIMAAQAKLFFTKLIGNVFIFASLIGSLALADYAWALYIDPSRFAGDRGQHSHVRAQGVDEFLLRPPRRDAGGGRSAQDHARTGA